jgi:(p)ppGpp synthase/HD superfamily hydrolase
MYALDMISARMQSAIDFALEEHAGQVDKAGRPYFGHVLRVALSVLHLGENYFITAILHDVMEDCGVTIEYITERWGAEVAFAVNSVSRITLPVKETYMNLIERAALNEIGIEVKLADLEDNMQPEIIAALPPESRDIVKRYERAKNRLLQVKRYKQILRDGGGA